jgi:hypothetical protein
LAIASIRKATRRFAACGAGRRSAAPILSFLVGRLS